MVWQRGGGGGGGGASDSDTDSSCRDVNSAAGTRKDYYKILGVDCDASSDSIRINYLRLALKWHPDKYQGEDSAATLKFQEINEAYTVLSDPVKRREYDMRVDFNVQQYSIIEYLNRFKGLILTCNGLGIGDLSEWMEELVQLGYDLSDEVANLYNQ